MKKFNLDRPIDLNQVKFKLTMLNDGTVKILTWKELSEIALVKNSLELIPILLESFRRGKGAFRAGTVRYEVVKSSVVYQ